MFLGNLGEANFLLETEDNMFRDLQRLFRFYLED